MTSGERGLLRDRGEEEKSKVTFVELFFDLVFVFAVTQLSHSLLEHFTAIGAVETTLLLMAVWWVGMEVESTSPASISCRRDRGLEEAGRCTR